MLDARIVITGVGLLTPLGGSAWETFRSLLAGRTLAERAAAMPEGIDPVMLARAVGSVATAGGAGVSQAGSAVELAERAIREAALAAGLPTEGLRGVAMWVGSSKGAVGEMGETGKIGERTRAKPHDLERLAGVEGARQRLGPHGFLSVGLMQRLGLESRGHCVAACASGLVALHRARLAMLHGGAGFGRVGPRRAVVASSEAALTPPFIHSYRRLGVLAPLTPGEYRERPLEEGRTGFVLAQAGAAVLLERLDMAEPMPPGAVELMDTAEANDPYDLIRPSPGLPAVEHLTRRLTSQRRIEAVHPHAPGTAEHDPAEMAAIVRGLGLGVGRGLDGSADRPRAYACKGGIGHALGAAGLSALVLACLAYRARRLPPMPWLETPIPSPMPMSREGVMLAGAGEARGGHLVLASGFAGHTAAAVVGGDGVMG